MTPEKIAHYEIIERMGAGGMGVVYRARDPRLDRVVAIKVLTSRLSDDPNARARFIQEARAASALDHPNICAIYEIDEDENGQSFIVMAHYDGQTLDGLLAKGPLSAGEALAIVIQVADGLAKAHSRGITHRDIKPANVMLTRDGVAKILDFGLAKVVGAEGVTRTGQSVGTPAYMAPEQIKGDAVDHRADIWALGVMLFELLTGQRPFKGEHPQAVMYAVATENPRALTDVWPDAPAGVQEIIEKCLRKNPLERYQEAAQVRNDVRLVLRRLQDEGSSQSVAQEAYASSVQAVLRLEHARRGSGRRMLARALTIVGGIAVLAAAGWFGYRALRPDAGEALRVLVAPPEVHAAVDSTTAQLAASNVEVALVRGLAGMKNVAALQSPGATTTLLDRAKALAADEIVSVTLNDTGRDWQVTFNRLNGADGNVIWTSGFSAPYGEPLLLANATLARLTQAYPERARDDATIEVYPADYAVFLRQYDRFVRAGAGPKGANRPTLDSLETIRKHSPRFVDAYLLESKVARYLFEVEREPGLLERARDVAREAQRVAPDDPRPSDRLFDAALVAGNMDEAKAAIEELRRVDPGNVEILRREARVADKEGDSDRALALMRRVVERYPARVYLAELANMEYAHGHFDACRQHLEQILQVFPNDVYGRSKLASVELLYGDVSIAARLYESLVRESPGVPVLTNLGIAQELLGKYDEAAVNFKRAAQIAPGNAGVWLNLADCEKLAGRTAAADSLYQHVIALIDEGPDPTGLANLQMRAQGLAHLGRRQEAVATIQEALQQDPDDAWTFYAAAVVYVAVGDLTSALVNSRLALARGVEARWFSLGFFEVLKTEPEFQALVARDPIPAQ